MEDEPFITDASFNTEEVSLRSTCRDRTLHSIQSLLSSLFPIQYVLFTLYWSREYKSTYPIIKINSDDTCCLNSMHDEWMLSRIRHPLQGRDS